ncbi:MAG: FAD-binding protein, partial [Gemmatimonadaceae bacterium]|nr:FAD-binding protein [Gloeobacterales cyanobacterium ES-bin-141]
YSMGGVPTTTVAEVLDIHDRPIEGFFAAGEAACVSVHGANRLGSNSLLECIVFGKQAGSSIARYVRAKPGSLSGLDEDHYLAEARALLAGLLEQPGHIRIDQLRRTFQDTMTDHASIFRDADGLQEGLDKIHQLKARYSDIRLDDQGTVFNTEIIEALELRSLLTVGEMILTSALERRESRGAHYRTDYPERDDVRFLKHTLAYCQEGHVQIDSRPVDLSLQLVDPARFTPQERKY